MSKLAKVLTAQNELPSPDERRRLRESADLSIRSFAQALGVSPSTVARWEGDAGDPSGRYLIVYVDALRLLATTGRENDDG